ncbi:MAG: DUF2017 family protein [Actinomycetota bacterium]
MTGLRRRVKRLRRGSFELRIPPNEREVLATLPDQLRELLTTGDPLQDPAMRRLYPAAYLDDPDAAAEFDGFVRDDLTAQRMAAIGTMARTVEATRVSEDELVAWLGAINDLRLILGVRLSVTEESGPDDFAGDAEREASYALYSYLSLLQEEIVEALSGA